MTGIFFFTCDSNFLTLIYRHEHLYTKISNNVIRSDNFTGALKQELNGVQVILCTLSMLSNARVGLISQANPVTTLVIDEASQIEVGEYMAVFTAYKPSLRKLCFIGDDKQCKSVFLMF
jgi:hypothetical protein